ncbi:hypothetical protein [Haloarcula onubensis]|uniref:Uncharacterized protein n=1 Tax=Haloarcula onubensis TaxID=2950539 RepID=A0ABU2FUL5_9EURY|nr:hypothetical protein [Halomicroarcula sp. S3CR25-11]MDS0283957.1 hypothetical protein [Halomicroarcula sp. S3CR25-11]
MRASIEGEDEEGCGLEILDNDGIEHWIEIKYDRGDISYHEQDGYPDKPAKRTNEGNEHVEQARRFAKYHVYRERGYETIARRHLPEVVAAVAVTVASLSPEEFDEQFGTYYQQFRSTFDADVEPVIDPPGTDDDGTIVYLQDVYLDADLPDLLDDDQIDAIQAALDTETSLDELESQLGQDLIDIDSLLNPASLSVKTSGLGTIYQRAGSESITEPSGSLDRPTDARLQLPPKHDSTDEYMSPETFQFLIFHHLVCQVRDCYLRLGLEPPEAVRVLGIGTYRQTIRNQYLDMFPPVHSTTSPVDGYRLPGIGSHLEG